jgi:hypothetical protein
MAELGRTSGSAKDIEDTVSEVLETPRDNELLGLVVSELAV